MPIELNRRADEVRWTACWVVLSFAWLSCTQQPPGWSYTPTQAELSALVECEESVLGATQKNAIRSGIYDHVYGRWLIQDKKAEEIIRCLVERHGWSALSGPDGRRGAQAPR